MYTCTSSIYIYDRDNDDDASNDDDDDDDECEIDSECESMLVYDNVFDDDDINDTHMHITSLQKSYTFFQRHQLFSQNIPRSNAFRQQSHFIRFAQLITQRVHFFFFDFSVGVTRQLRPQPRNINVGDILRMLRSLMDVIGEIGEF